VDAQLDGVRQQARGDPRERVVHAALAAVWCRAARIRDTITARAEVGSAAVAAMRVACRPGLPLPVTGWLWADRGGCLFQLGGRGGGLTQRRGHRYAMGKQDTRAPCQPGQGTVETAGVVQYDLLTDRAKRGGIRRGR